MITTLKTDTLMYEALLLFVLNVLWILLLGSEYDSYGTSGVDYSPPPSPRYGHKHSQMRRSSKHSPDR